MEVKWNGTITNGKTRRQSEIIKSDLIAIDKARLLAGEISKQLPGVAVHAHSSLLDDGQGIVIVHNRAAFEKAFPEAEIKYKTSMRAEIESIVSRARNGDNGHGSYSR